ncbi:hypothetical protein HDU93_001240, partial [Gonapodya sp. JEL0774]
MEAGTAPVFWQPGSSGVGNNLHFRSRKVMPYTRLEREYRAVLDEILNKPRWWIKMKDPIVLGKWEKEAGDALADLHVFHMAFDTNSAEYPWHENSDTESDDDRPPSEPTSDSHSERADDGAAIEDETVKRTVNGAVAFLRYHLQEIATHGLVALQPISADGLEKHESFASPTTGHGIFLSDELVLPDAISAFSRVVLPLEAESLLRGDWHPGTTGVLDIVHPSMYCLVYGHTLTSAAPNALAGDIPTISVGSKSSELSDISRRFQWLPTDVTVDTHGRATITSYINNLDRHAHPRVYGAMRAVFEGMVPMFERAVEALETAPKRLIDASLSSDDLLESLEEWQRRNWLEEKYGSVEASPPNLRESTQWDWPDDVLTEFEKYCDMYKGEIDRTLHAPDLPEPNTVDFSYLDSSHKVNLKGRTLQVIFKLATICLTPENPEYDGGNWHLEGTENEAIAATGLFYYAVENITPSRLTFRQVYDAWEFGYEQSDYGGLEQVYGFHNDHSSNVQLSSQVEARTGRCVVFPNFLQHRVEPFQLKDRSKPGYRRVLAMFLVHPDNRIASTSFVPPQQAEIIKGSLRATLGSK